MTCRLDKRFPDAGFVMVDVGTKNERRMLFGPKSDFTHSQKETPNELCLSTGNWGRLTKKQIDQCVSFLQTYYPDKTITILD